MPIISTKRWVVFFKHGCPWCERARAALQLRRARPVYIDKDILTAEQVRCIQNASGMNTWPQIWLRGKLIGGFAELDKYLSSNK